MLRDVKCLLSFPVSLPFRLDEFPIPDNNRYLAKLCRIKWSVRTGLYSLPFYVIFFYFFIYSETCIKRTPLGHSLISA